MSELVVVGLSHHTADLELRECAALPGPTQIALMRELVESGLYEESLVVSTCNRVELYGTTRDLAKAVAAAEQHLAKPSDDLKRVLYVREGDAAVRHAFRVAASLDSMVVGEPQILGQVKEAFEQAQSTGTLGNLLGRCFQRSFAVAKRVRTETSIAEGTVSVSSIAVDLARKIFGELSGRRVLLLGAGEMGEAAAKSLANSGSQLVVLNRSPEKAEKVAKQCGGQAEGYEHLASELISADVVITSTSSPTPVLSDKMMRGVSKARRGRPLFLIDIAVPRDVDPRVGELESVFLYDVDDLQKVACENLSQRKAAASHAEQIVEEEVLAFRAWRGTQHLKPTIVAMRKQVADAVQAELARTLPRLPELTPKQQKSLDKMADSIVKRVLHQPLMALKDAAEDPDGAELIAAAQTLFAIDPDAERERDEGDERAPALQPKPIAPGE